MMNDINSRIFGRLISLFVCLGLILGQTACSIGKQLASTTEDPNLSNSEGQIITDLPRISDQKKTPRGLDTEEGNIVITFASYGFERPLFEPLMEAFHQENPSITVKFVELPIPSSESTQSELNYYRTLASAADTSQITGRSMSMSAFFRDLQPLIDMDAAFDSDDFWPGALTGCQDSGGRVLGLPLNLFLNGVFFDEQSFIDAGLPYPLPGWTWDDFRNKAVALAKQGGDTTRYGYADPPYFSVLEPLIGTRLAETGGKIDVQVIAAELQWYLDLTKRKALYPIQGTEGGEAGQQADKRWKGMFQVNRPPAMWYGRLQEPVPGLAGVSEDTDPAIHLAITQFGFAPLPVATDGSNTKTTPITAQCVAISAGSSHPQAAWTWANFLTQHHLVHDKTQVAERLIIPARQSVAEVSGFWTNLPTKIQPAVRYGLEHGWYGGAYQPTEYAVYAALEKAVIEGVDLVSALTEADSKLAALPQAVADTEPIIIATPRAGRDNVSNAVVVNFYPGSVNSQEIGVLKTLVDRFNQDHADKIEIQMTTDYFFPSNLGYFESLSKTFDCFISQVDPMGAASSGTVLGLNTLLDGENSAFRQDYDVALLDASRYEGELYDLPLVSQPTIMVYNADLLAKRGLQPPSNGWSFNDFLQQITVVASTSDTDKSYGVLPESQAVDITGILYAGHNTQWLDVSGDLPVAKFDTPDMVNTLTWLTELYRSGTLFQSATGENWWTSITQAIQSGEIAYWTVLAGQQNMMYFDTNQKPLFKIGIAPLPSADTANISFDASIERGFFISRQSQNPQACWSWAKFLTEQPVYLNGIPARNSVAMSPAWEASVGVDNAKIYRLALARLQRSSTKTYSKILSMPLESWKGQAEMNVRMGSDPREALAQAQQKANAYQSCLAVVDLSKLNDLEIRAKVTGCAKQADPSW